MAIIDRVQLPDGTSYDIRDTQGNYATETYVQNQIQALTKASVGLGNVDNTSDLSKPVSTLQQAALNTKANLNLVTTVESALVASKEYYVCDRFIYNGNIYVVTDDIAEEGVITIDTNCVLSKDIEAQINGTGNALFLGDSYSDRSTGYTSALPDLIGATMKYENIFNYAIAGAGYVNGSGTQEHFEGQFDSAISALTDTEKINIKYVYVLGGQNDNGQTTTNLVNACVSLFTKIRNTLPNAKIVALPLWYNRALSEANCIRFPIIYNCAIQYNALTDTNSWAYLLNKSVGFMVDGVHPTQDGLRFLAGCICNLVKGGNSLIPQNDLITIDTNIISSTNALMTNYSNGFVHINGDFVAGSNGIPNQATIFTVDPIFAPQKGAYYQIPQLGSNSSYMFILGSDGVFKAYQAVPANAQLAINISWSMCS